MVPYITQVHGMLHLNVPQIPCIQNNANSKWKICTLKHQGVLMLDCIHGILQDLPHYMEMDVELMEEIQVDVMAKITYLADAAVVAYREEAVEDMLVENLL